MAAFDSQVDLEKWYVKTAEELNAKTEIDDETKEKLADMNAKGRNGIPGCLCAIKFSKCPCLKASEQIVKYGECNCELFEKA